MPDGLPGHAALTQACHAFGLTAEDAVLLHHRSNAVYLLPHDQIVARLAPPTPLRQQRAHTAITVTRWLATQPNPIALAPLPGQQPVITADAVATFWPYRPTTPPPTLTDLAVPLRRLHALPAPPFPLPDYQPLHRLKEALDLDRARHQPALSRVDRNWLTEQTHTLIEQFSTTRFPLGTGLVHADAHSENLVRHNDTDWVLIDWDQTCHGPRELDLITGLPSHFHEPETNRTAFLLAYGHDPTQTPGWQTLRDIAELHSLASYIRLAPTKPPAATELTKRITSLRTGDQSSQWQAIS